MRIRIFEKLKLHKEHFHKRKKELLHKLEPAKERILPKLSWYFKLRDKAGARFTKMVPVLNKFSLVFHMLLACLLCLMIETISRHSLISAFSFVFNHSWAYLYNSFIIFATMSIVYLFRRRAMVRFLISGLWLFLGTVNGCILAKRVTPFSYTDLTLIQDLFAMKNTSYFTASEACLVVIACACFALFCVHLWRKGPKFAGQNHYFRSVLIITVCCLMIPLTTKAAQSSNVIASYFANIAQGYEEYGFVYGFSSSVVARGMSKPSGYSEESVDAVETAVAEDSMETTVTADSEPNIIVVLLESFVDPDEVNFLEYSEDPVPTFHSLEENYSTGHLTVPVVGAGTANTEFEILTGMSMEYFGTGEYPYKTILKETDCESIASDLSSIGYGTHVVHNNGGNFYSRANAFSMMGFDTFTSKELMNIQTYTELGSWATDDILVGETIKALDSTEGSDFVYTITVQAHGDYPTESVIEDPAITVSGMDSDESHNQWEYYINQLHAVDTFINDLTTELSERDEDTIVVFFGDHLPSLGLEEDDMATGSIFETKYVTWNNFGLEKDDEDLTSYQLLAEITDQLGIHEGTMFNYHQTQMDNETVTTTDGDSDETVTPETTSETSTVQTADSSTDDTTITYQEGLDLLQYDLLYGSRYAYNGVDLYTASDLVMGIDDVVVKNAWTSSDGNILIYGESFTPWSRVYINGEKVSTTFISDTQLKISSDDVSDGDTIVVNVLGSRSTIFRSSNEYTYEDYLTDEDSDSEEVSDEAESDGVLSNIVDTLKDDSYITDDSNPAPTSEEDADAAEEPTDADN